MNHSKLRPAAVVSGTGPGSGICSAAPSISGNTTPTIAGQGVIDLRTWGLRKRFGLNEATARLLSSHVYGDRDDDLGDWISLADAAANAIDAMARAYEAQS